MWLPRLFTFTIFSCLLFNAASIAAQLNSSQARKMIARVAGSNLPTSAVRIKQISNGSSPEVTAEIETAFTFEQTPDGHWLVKDVRIAPDLWEDVNLILEALGEHSPRQACVVMETARDYSLSVRRARCLLAALFHIQLPSDAVRIKSLSGMDLPFGTSSSAAVVANITLQFRFAPQAGSMSVVGMRSGNGNWVNLGEVSEKINRVKRSRALAELQSVAKALSEFRVQRGHYVATDSHALLVDFLSPTYLVRVVRVDPWHRPYEYLGEPNRFTLRSGGPDRKTNTADDVVLSGP